MKKINDIVKDELGGNKQLIDNLNHKIGVVEKVIKAIVLNIICIFNISLFSFGKEMERISDVVNYEVDGSKQIIDNLTKKKYIIEKVIKAIKL